MSKDALQLWEMAGLMTVGWVIALVFGRLPSKGYWVKRSEMPVVFWVVMAIFGGACLAVAWWALYLTVPPL